VGLAAGSYRTGTQREGCRDVTVTVTCEQGIIQHTRLKGPVKYDVKCFTVSELQLRYSYC
jgi:hypothetical protein